MDKLRARLKQHKNGDEIISYTGLMQGILANHHDYLAFKSIRCLHSFLSGFHYVLTGQNSYKNLGLELDYFDGFAFWIAKSYKITSSHSWSNIILFHSTDEIEAFHNFFQLLEIFTMEQTEEAYLSPSRMNTETEKSFAPYEIDQSLIYRQHSLNVFELFEDMKKRPYLYLDSYGLNHLYSFMQGFACAKSSLGLAIGSDENALWEFLASIEKKYQTIGNVSWLKIIQFESQDDIKALGRFFDLWKNWGDQVNKA